mmetsp:Transcript_44513/g.83473  ORF Transcript_44513/g.83473 Transcript_44513/m.83473 type:complete len:373 (-) Transcript_44513:321-1439(-)
MVRGCAKDEFASSAKMQSTALPIDRSKGSGKAHSKGKAKGKGVPRHCGNGTAKGNYNYCIFAGKGKGKSTRELQGNGKVNHPKGKAKGSILPTKGKDNANGKGARELHGNHLKGKGKGGILSPKGKGKATESAALNAAVFCKSYQTAVHSANGSSATGKRLGRIGPRTVTCPAGGNAAGNGRRKKRKNLRSKRHPNSSNSAVCAICQEGLDGACDRLDCMHAFHVACASRCVAHVRRAGCPICRAPAPLWLSGVSAKDSIDVMTSSSESEAASSSVYYQDDVEHLYEQGEITDSEYSQDDLSNVTDQLGEPAHSRVLSVSDFDDHYADVCWYGEIDQLHDEYPDLDSDALHNLFEERMQDFDESGSYYSHGS